MTDPLTPPAPGSEPAYPTYEGFDHLVEETGNGLQPDDPDEQPSQDPDELPAGTVTADPEGQDQ